MSDRSELQGRSVSADLRVDYGGGRLDEADVLPDPVEQFGRWFDEARAANVAEPNAMTLATVDAVRRPSARIVLLKDFDARGFTFYTNYDSRKGRELAANPRAALCFLLAAAGAAGAGRGDGRAGGAREESEAYFHSRPRRRRSARGSRSRASPLASRAELERLEAELSEAFGDGPVPLPEHWGGLPRRPRIDRVLAGPPEPAARPAALHAGRPAAATPATAAWPIAREPAACRRSCSRVQRGMIVTSDVLLPRGPAMARSNPSVLVCPTSPCSRPQLRQRRPAVPTPNRPRESPRRPRRRRRNLRSPCRPAGSGPSRSGSWSSRRPTCRRRSAPHRHAGRKPRRRLPQVVRDASGTRAQGPRSRAGRRAHRPGRARGQQRAIPGGPARIAGRGRGESKRGCCSTPCTSGRPCTGWCSRPTGRICSTSTRRRSTSSWRG